ncbi:MAG TPA: hypothetical protein DCE09_02665 [Thermoanaerobacter sp.]|nr:hypothetical protein [Thermoanaerobacter sp.]
MTKNNKHDTQMCLYGTREICLWVKGIYLTPLEACPSDCPIRQTTPKPQIKTKRFKGSNTIIMP